MKDALESVFFGKCAYCESFYVAVGPVDVEHYRPKGELRLPDGIVDKPGYYWLAATWDNLLPSCVDCNRRRGTSDAGGDALNTGKGSEFPLEDETRRARREGEEVNEVPLLLNPCEPEFDPEMYLEFLDDGLVRVAQPGEQIGRRAEETIKLLGLQRKGLVDARADRTTFIDASLKRLREVSEDLEECPNDERLQARQEDAMRDLKKHLEPQAPYSVMARQRISRELGEIIGSDA